MKTCLLKGILLMAGWLMLGQFANAQKKLLVLGSSTSTCFFGPSSVENCYITRLQRYYESIGLPVTVDNRAVGGDNIYLGMPLNYTPPEGRNRPRAYNNITEGLAGNPDVVLINYPSNGYDVFSVDEVMNCFRIIKQTANNAGKPCYITTPQPRNDPQSFTTQEVRNKMAEIKNRVLAEFGTYAINFWDGIANPDNSLQNDKNTDGIHINDAGHLMFFERVREKDIFQHHEQTPPTPPVPTPPTPPAPTPPFHSSGNGLSYKYYEGNYSTLPDFNALQPVKTGSVNNIDISLKNRPDNYAFLWEGYINIPLTGEYTFEIISDDGSKFYFNTGYSHHANALVNNDGVHPAQSASNSTYIHAGTYPVAISFFENSGGDRMEFYWSGPGIPRQLIPNAAFSHSGSAMGSLNYKYYEGSWTMLPDFHTLQPVKSGSVGNVDISPRNVTEYYAFLWEGYINIPAPGDYYFETISDDGSKLYFNSHYDAGATPLVNNDGMHSSRSAGNHVYIGTAGRYPVAISYFQNYGSDQIEVYWSGPGFERQPIPAVAFSASANASNVAVNSQSQLVAGATNNNIRTIGAFPNPFNQTLDITYFNNNAGNYINAGLYDLSGKLVHRENFKNLPAGSTTLKMNLKDARSMANGIYFLKIDVNGVPFKVMKLVKSKG